MSHEAHAAPGAAPQRPSPTGFGRHVVESLLFLTIAVLICRVFFAEGFMISTGSMAPSLLGYHRQIICPECGLHFARGARYPEELNWSSEARAQDLAGDMAPITSTICPNCLAAIDASVFPVNEGDQLMVHKYAYELRDPHRWEVVVFRNPADATQPYVKRVAGLPSEALEIRGGDIYADGQLQRKPLDIQRSLRILVDDHDHQPEGDDLDRQTRWASVEGRDSFWNDAEGVLTFDDAGSRDTAADAVVSDAAPDFDWLAFRHWIRDGGRHLTRVPLADWPQDLSVDSLVFANVTYDADGRALECLGAVSWEDCERAKALDNSREWQQAWDAVFRESHCTAITDIYGYNHPDAALEGFIVRDIMVACEVAHVAGDGIFIVRLTDGSAIFDCEFDFAHREVRLYANNRPDPLRVSRLPAAAMTENALIEMSIFDRQVSVAVNAVDVFKPVRYTSHRPSTDITAEITALEQSDETSVPVATSDTPAPRHPVLLGAERLSLEVRHLQVFRDVYYTPKGDAPYHYELGDDEFFLLGDNSPVSADSRAWDDPAISRDLLIGKPLMVHLPSQQLPLDWGGETHYVRIPDPSRIRWIR